MSSWPAQTIGMRRRYEDPPVQQFACDDLKYIYSASHQPIGTVKPGETFRLSTEDCFTALFRHSDGYTPENIAFVNENLNGVTGPIFVEGARPGQVLAVHIEDLRVTTPGSVVLSRFSYPSPQDWWLEETSCTAYPVLDGMIHLSDSIHVPVRPLIGCIATAPKLESPYSKCEGEYGGNLDCNEMTAGATIILPVAVEGALLYFGDCKARMGDGEVVVCPEVGTLITATVELRPAPTRMHGPRVENADSLITLASTRTLDDACRMAFKYMLWWLEDEYHMEHVQAALLMGMVAHAGICQVSNPLMTAKCIMPRTFLPQTGV
jgi:acetamidase/formamidase